MMTLLFMITVGWVVWKIAIMGIRMTWGLTKFVFGLIVFPILVIGLFFAGLVYLAVPLLAVVGLVALLGGITRA